MIRTFIPFPLIAALVFLSPACSENNTGVPMQNNAKTDVELLRKFIELPKAPLSVKWQTGDMVTAQNQSTLGPKDWGLVAILEFKSDDITELAAASGVIENKKTVALPETFMWDWVKPALGVHSEKVNHYYPLEGTARKADVFSRSPLLNGYWVQLQGNTILLYLYTR